MMRVWVSEYIVSYDTYVHSLSRASSCHRAAAANMQTINTINNVALCIYVYMTYNMTRFYSSRPQASSIFAHFLYQYVCRDNKGTWYHPRRQIYSSRSPPPSSTTRAVLLYTNLYVRGTYEVYKIGRGFYISAGGWAIGNNAVPEDRAAPR